MGRLSTQKRGQLIWRVKANFELATDVYIDRVNGCPCGETVIHLYRGADSSSLQQKWKDLLVYLKGRWKKSFSERSLSCLQTLRKFGIWDRDMRSLSYPHSAYTFLSAALKRDVHTHYANLAKRRSPWNGFQVGPRLTSFHYPYQTQPSHGVMSTVKMFWVLSRSLLETWGSVEVRGHPYEAATFQYSERILPKVEWERAIWSHARECSKKNTSSYKWSMYVAGPSENSRHQQETWCI